jgi:hypothetical protein
LAEGAWTYVWDEQRIGRVRALGVIGRIAARLADAILVREIGGQLAIEKGEQDDRLVSGNPPNSLKTDAKRIDR